MKSWTLLSIITKVVSSAEGWGTVFCTRRKRGCLFWMPSLSLSCGSDLLAALAELLAKGSTSDGGLSSLQFECRCSSSGLWSKLIWYPYPRGSACLLKWLSWTLTVPSDTALPSYWTNFSRISRCSSSSLTRWTALPLSSLQSCLRFARTDSFSAQWPKSWQGEGRLDPRRSRQTSRKRRLPRTPEVRSLDKGGI